MAGTRDAEDWIARFPGLSGLETTVRERLVREGRITQVPAGTRIFGPGKPPTQLLLLLDGSVRVQQTSEGGREIVLYRIEAGQSCVLTTACLLAYEDYLAEGIAETDVTAVAVPRQVFDELLAGSAQFRSFVFTAYSRRITDLFRVIDEVAFQRVDIRLAQRLVDLSRGTGAVRATHQELAAELGTAREVISRQLQEFQRRGWIAQARGAIALRDRAALEALAAERT
jgi:CRP/FNR family transcriptional regulator, anaerobic regulatory protein